MRICLMIEGQEGVEWGHWSALATAAEAAGLDGLFRSDHYRSIGRGDPAGSLDAWTTLAALAARTTALRLGTMVSPVTFRPASVLAKSVTTVDHISGGRVELGIGAGWFEAEHQAYAMRCKEPGWEELRPVLLLAPRQVLAALQTWARRVGAAAEDGADAYVYFNNDPGGAAVRNARTFLAVCR